MKTENLNYSFDEQNYTTFVAYPENDGAPLVLIAHAWGGRDNFVEEKAIELAKEGFVAMAVDMYGDGKQGTTIEENQSLMTPLVEDRKRLKSIINAALEQGKKFRRCRFKQNRSNWILFWRHGCSRFSKVRC